jgi:RNA polymerase sigma factor (sigma-70 family)
MDAMNDIELLREYASRHSEAAFAALVQRYVGLIYSAALRRVGDPGMAEDVTQTVFIILARKGHALGRRKAISGWLYQTMRFAASEAVRSRVHRQQREQEAAQMENHSVDDTPWEQIAPLLEPAMDALSAKNRQAVLLRYFQNKSLADVGVELGTSEEAAKKRVARALEKLRAFFARRGVAFSSVAIAGAVSAHSVQAAPAALVAATTAAALAKGVAASSSTLTLVHGALKLMAWAKAKTAVVLGVGVLLGAGTTTVVIERQNEAKQYTVASEPWSEAGAATPKAALESLVWALTRAKFDRARQLVQWDVKGVEHGGIFKAPHEIYLKSSLAPALKDMESFRILSIEPTQQAGEVMVKFEKTFKDRNSVPQVVTAKLRRAGRQWRVVANIEYFQSGNVSMMLPFTGSF